ncbi:MAG: hypothetical protein ACFCUQ_12820 [Kiloniellales bacterium]
MPVEMRTLIFSRDEVAEALTEHAEQGGGSLPRGRVIYCQVGCGPDFSMVVKLGASERTEIQTVTLDAEAVGAALIDFCLRRAIPLPRNASRSLQVLGEALALSLAINEVRAPLPAFA